MSSSEDDIKADQDGYEWTIDESIPNEERKYYFKVYSNLNNITERKVHCTVCQDHIGTAPCQEKMVRMHPILRISHCEKCHGFYSSGDFDKGEDGSELYCRWCGQGGQVYCCSKCPFVFCKPCIVSNLSPGIIQDIENNENWSCFSCSPKIIWPLRAQHWALINYIDKQKKIILSGNHTENEVRKLMTKDTSSCCRGKQDSKLSEASEIMKVKHSEKRVRRILPKEGPANEVNNILKKIKLSNGVVCTPDILQIIEPNRKIPITSKIINTKKPYGAKNLMTQATVVPKRVVSATSTPPLLVASITRKSVSPTPTTTTAQTPVFHTINGFRIDLNSAAKQETFRLPNGKLIQVKRQNPTKTNTVTSNNMTTTTVQTLAPQVVTSSIRVHPTTVVQANPPVYRGQIQPRATITQVPGTQLTQYSVHQTQVQTIPSQTQQILTQSQNSVATVRFQSTQAIQANTIANIQSGTIQVINNTPPSNGVSVRSVSSFVKQQYGSSPLGRTRTQLQTQVSSTWDVCQLINNKILNYTNSNAYKNVRNNMQIKELYIHLSYMLSYAMGRFKEIQEKCLQDMRTLGFNTDANSLENGQLAADKQASDDEDGDIEIVEPKRDTINLDSDDEDDEDVLCPILITKKGSDRPRGNTYKVLNLVNSNNGNDRANAREKRLPKNGPTQKLDKNVVKKKRIAPLSALPKENFVNIADLPIVLDTNPIVLDPKPTVVDPNPTVLDSNFQMQCIVVMPDVDENNGNSQRSDSIITISDQDTTDGSLASLKINNQNDNIENMEVDTEVVERHSTDKCTDLLVPLTTTRRYEDNENHILELQKKNKHDIFNKETRIMDKDLILDESADDTQIEHGLLKAALQQQPKPKPKPTPEASNNRAIVPEPKNESKTEPKLILPQLADSEKNKNVYHKDDWMQSNPKEKLQKLQTKSILEAGSMPETKLQSLQAESILKADLQPATKLQTEIILEADSHPETKLQKIQTDSIFEADSKSDTKLVSKLKNKQDISSKEVLVMEIDLNADEANCDAQKQSEIEKGKGLLKSALEQQPETEKKLVQAQETKNENKHKREKKRKLSEPGGKFKNPKLEAKK